VTADVKACVLALERLSKDFDRTARRITSKALDTVQAAGRGFAPIGTPGNTTAPPGTLKESILVQAPRGADGLYYGEVGPTTIYGRQRELGGHIYPKHAKALRFVKFGDVVYTRHVYQKPEPYMKPGRDASLLPIREMAREQVAKTISSGTSEEEV
jgi:hypothetical protein